MDFEYAHNLSGLCPNRADSMCQKCDDGGIESIIKEERPTMIFGTGGGPRPPRS